MKQMAEKPPELTKIKKVKEVAKVPETAFNGEQLGLFQSLLANNQEERDAASNSIEIWDTIPRCSVSRLQQSKMRIEGRFLDTIEIGFQLGGRQLAAEIRPAQVKDKKTGKYISYYPSAREELIELALRKLAAEQQAGFFDDVSYRSGLRFTLHALRTELENQGHSLRYDELIEGLQILHFSNISVSGDGTGDDEHFVSSSYLPALSGVGVSKTGDNSKARFAVEFHPLVTRSINKMAYRQNNYKRLMSCKSQLQRWILNQLVLKNLKASSITKFTIKYSTIKRDSGLLEGYSRERDAIAAVTEAFEGLKTLTEEEKQAALMKGQPLKGLTEEQGGGVIGQLEITEELDKRGKGSPKLIDVSYTISPTKAFIAEQVRANGRLKLVHEGKKTPV
jgi:hypothetical protein